MGQPVEQVWHEIVSGLAEAWTNIVLHSCHGLGSAVIGMSTSVGPEGLAVHLRDDGRPFHPEHLARPGMDPTTCEAYRPAPGSERGMGLFIMHAVMDAVVYTPGGPGRPNDLLLWKRWSWRGEENRSDSSSEHVHPNPKEYPG